MQIELKQKLETKNQEIIEKQTTINQTKTELDDRIKDLEFRNNELNKKQEEFKILQNRLEGKDKINETLQEDLQLFY